MTWTRWMLVGLMMAFLPLVAMAEVVQLTEAPSVDKGVLVENGTICTWPGSVMMTEGIDLNAEPFVPDIRANLMSIPAEEIASLNAGRDLDDYAQIFIDGFFPGWDANWAGPYGGGYDDDGVFHNWRWTERTERSSVGSYAAYCAGDATEVPDPLVDTYPDDMVTWMYYGPVDMSMYDGAAARFDYFLDCESRYDNFFAGISTDGVNFDGRFYSGYEGVWTTDEQIELDFPGGAGSVYFLFKFSSDYTVSSGEGVWLDQVRLYGETDGDPDLRITSITWSPTNPAPGATTTFTVNYTNVGVDNAGPFYIDMFTDEDGVAPDIGQIGDLYYYDTDGLLSGGSQSTTFTRSYTPNGTYWVWGLIDTDELVDESNESNNRHFAGKVPVGQATVIYAGPVSPGLVPVGGGVISYPVSGTQYTAARSGRAWITISYEGYGNAVEVLVTNTMTLYPGSPVNPTLNTYIPGNAPGGGYQINVNFGSYPWMPYDSGRATFSKAGPVPNGATSFGNMDFETWGDFDGLAGEAVAEVSLLPEEFAMSAAYPNPFNPSTTISVALPEAAELNVTVFNLQGQQVATIAQGQHQAGNHQMVFDGSGMASGVYLVQASAGSGETAVQKIMLLK